MEITYPTVKEQIETLEKKITNAEIIFQYNMKNKFLQNDLAENYILLVMLNDINKIELKSRNLEIKEKRVYTFKLKK